MELQAITGQLYIVAGQAQAGEIPGLVAQSAPAKAARSRVHDSLFIHLSLSGQPQEYETLAQDLVEAISRRFYATGGSVTAALRNAITEANQLLLRLNLSRSGPAREGALTCAVLRRQELFIVQVGEALAMIGRNFGVERFPPEMPARFTPLGRTAGLDMRFYHNWIEAGDMLLLADPRAAHLGSDTLRPILVDSTVEDSLPRLAQVMEDTSARLLLVEFTDETPVGIPDTVAPLPATPAPAADTGRRLSPPTGTPQRQQTPVQQAAETSPGRSLSLPEIDLPTATAVEDSARRATSNTMRGLAGFTGWLAAVMQRLRPARSAEESDGAGRGWALPALLAVIIPIVVALIIGGVYIQRGRVARMSEIQREMQAALGLADQASEEAAARTQYNRVLQLAAEADTLRPGDGDVERLRQQAQFALDRIDDVTRLDASLLYRYEAGSDMERITLREGLNGDLYTLDRANNRAFVHETEEDYVTPSAEDPEVIVFGGQAVGTHIVGELVDMMWRPTGTQVSTEGIAFLDNRGALVTYQPNFATVRAVPLGLASDWKIPTAITQFNERAYILDTGAASIWRYFAEGDGFFVDDAQRALTLPDLAQAVDIDIYSEDGSVVVLYGDGRIRRYGQDSVLWDENNLLQSGMESPFIAPTRMKIIGRGLNSSIFVADPGSGRVVQLSVGGNFLAQYKAVDTTTGEELFADLGDFDVAEAPLRIFVVAGNGLYVATQE